MADKEATVYIVDVGKSMGEKNGGRSETDLEWCMKYVWDKITTAVRIRIAIPLRVASVTDPIPDGYGPQNALPECSCPALRQ